MRFRLWSLAAALLAASSAPARAACEVYNQSASAAINSGDYARAQREAEQAIAACRGGGAEAAAWNAAGLSFLYRGRYEEALERFRRAIDLDRRGGDREREIRHLNNAGNAYYYQGRYLDALREYHAARELVRQTSAEPWNGAVAQLTLANLAMLFQRLGRHPAALSLYRQIQSGPQALSSSVRARMLTNMGVLYRRLGDPVKALAVYREAQRLFNREHHADGELAALKNIGIVQALDLADLPAALAAFSRALSLAEHTSSRREVMQAHLHRGETYYRMGAAESAWRDWTRAGELAKALGTVDDEWKALHGRARVAAGRGDPQADEFLRRAISLIESLRGRLQVPSLKSDFLADKRDVYDSYIRLLARPGTPERRQADLVFDAMERARSRVLLDLVERSGDFQYGAARGKLAAIRAGISSRYAERVRAEGAEAARVESELATLENDYLAEERRLAERSPALGPMPVRPQTPDAIRRALPPGAALVEYWWTADWFAELTIGPSATFLRTRPLPPEVSGLLQELAAAASRPGTSEWREPSRRLGAMLLQDISRWRREGVRRLIVVPDGALSFLPFELLIQPGSDNRPLIADFEVSYLPAAALLTVAPARSRLRTPWGTGLLAFGAPAGEGPHAGLDLLPGDEQWILPRAGEELDAVARLLPGRAQVYAGHAARKQRLLAASGRQYSAIHIATHARADEEDAARSRILLRGDDPRRPFDYLFMDEIAALDLRAVDLVTLSACDTARGKLIEGEGAQSLTRAFLAGGARAVVSTLWPVEDRAALELMKQFYFELGRGSSKAAALRAAKLKLLNSRSALSHPAHWAGFVLTGEGWRPLPRPVPWSAFAAGLGLAGALAWLLRRWVQKRMAGTGSAAPLASGARPRT